MKQENKIINQPFYTLPKAERNGVREVYNFAQGGDTNEGTAAQYN
jgi:hypothetical protein